MELKKRYTVAELAAALGGEVRGEGGVMLSGVASLEAAGPEAVSFLGAPRFRELALSSRAGAIIVRDPLPVNTPQVVVADDPYAAFVKVMKMFHPEARPEPGVHPSAVVEAGAELAEGVHVGAQAVIGEGARIGARTVIGPGVVISAACELGEDCRLHARVTLYPGVKAGSRVIIHSGAVLGADGFGFVMTERGHVKKPQVGSVLIEDDVEIGANCTIDRAMLDATVIGAGTKLDNLVHLAHGVRVGRDCIILAGTVVGGSVRIGDRVMISGQCAIKDNIEIGEGAIIIGGTGVFEDVPAGATLWGMPAMPFSLAKRAFARLKQLPDLFTRVRKLEKNGKKPEAED